MSGNLYGPNHEQVAALIDRIAGMTPKQIEQLYEAGFTRLNTVLETTWYAARHAAWEATRDAAWDAAAWDARYDTRVAASDAACALVVRDLISPEHFDALYGPWASVMDGEYL